MPSVVMSKTKTPKARRPADTAWNMALRLLARRDFSTMMLRQRLLNKGFEEGSVEETLDRCRELGYLDDARYALNSAHYLVQQGRAVGKRVLLELRRRGISEHLAQRALDQVMETVNEDHLLEDLITRRFPDFAYLTATASERRRVVHFLQRRGFSLERIMNNLTRKGL